MRVQITLLDDDGNTAEDVSRDAVDREIENEIYKYNNYLKSRLRMPPTLSIERVALETYLRWALLDRSD